MGQEENLAEDLPRVAIGLHNEGFSTKAQCYFLLSSFASLR